ncbi:MAG: radical SAM protein [Pyrinomonadaceae bacterium]
MTFSRLPEQRAIDKPVITIELTNICNLHCRYCLRDEDALYHTKAHYLPLELLRRIIREARQTYHLKRVDFTGGEVTLHPQFGEIIEAVGAENLQAAFVTNGWHFERVYPALLAHRTALDVVAFSLDGATAEAHDCWRGKNSFKRVISAVTRCYMHNIPFIFKTVLRRDTATQVEQIALLAARLGAAGVTFAHFLPTSFAAANESALSLDEQKVIEHEITVLAGIFKMKIGLAAGFYDIDPAPHCAALRGTSCNVDYRGRLTLCCNLSGYRGSGEAEADVAADLTREEFGSAYRRLRGIAEGQVARRTAALAALSEKGERPDLSTGSPCLFCLHSFGKILWRSREVTEKTSTRALPVL